MIEVVGAPPFASVQDSGRPGFRAQGVPVSGAMDDEAATLVNAVVGNAADAAVLEWTAGPGMLRMLASMTVAVAGADAPCMTAAGAVPARTAISMRAGESLALGAPTRGRFCYLAVAGGIDVPLVLGSRATYLPAAMGGYDGRLLRAGDVLPTGRQLAAPGSVPAYLASALPTECRPRADTALIRVLPAPDEHSLDAELRARFHDTEFTVSPRSDRTGYRLDGATFRATVAPDAASRAMCPGAIQLPDAGSPLVLMRDGPTTGGYPVVAVVISADLGAMAQLAPRDRVRFATVDAAAAQAALEQRNRRLTAPWIVPA